VRPVGEDSGNLRRVVGGRQDKAGAGQAKGGTPEAEGEGPNPGGRARRTRSTSVIRDCGSVKASSTEPRVDGVEVPVTPPPARAITQLRTPLFRCRVC
jgi:hypothetical protein